MFLLYHICARFARKKHFKKYKQMFEKSFYMCYTVWKNKEMDILYPVDHKEKQYDSAKEIKRIYKNPGSQ